MENKNFKVDMTTHVLLLIFTFGIYQLFWIYKITEYTNLLKPNEQRNSISNLLLCMFMPFYSIFWYYKTAEIIFDCVDDSDNSFKTMTLILAIFVPFVAAILIQDKINKFYVSVNHSSQVTASNSKQYCNQINESTIIEEIKKYKELLDIGAITQEEFDIKKKEILGV